MQFNCIREYLYFYDAHKIYMDLGFAHLPPCSDGKGPRICLVSSPLTSRYRPLLRQAHDLHYSISV